MIDQAKINKKKLGYDNVEFRLGEIESLPLDENSVDVVVSNCVLNLVPDKEKAFSEVYRILKPGGHFCISGLQLNYLLLFMFYTLLFLSRISFIEKKVN